MRLHHLTVTAFGPFAGTERVDFDRLADTGLFLLRGATGAGKSSVLDAVCFALYGEVPGARKGNPLRSDHADPDRLTEVRLELTLGGRRLEITRSPEQRRPKRRGTGWTVEKPRTLLREAVADPAGGAPLWQALSTSHQEAGEEIRQLVGMSRDQFCQVVLLPQGDFARFLRADSKQRAELLGRLFDTRRFELLERWLAEQRQQQEAAVRDGRRRLRDLAARAEEAAGPLAEPAEEWLPAEDGPADGSAGLTDAVLAWAAVLRVGAAEQLAVAGSGLAGAELAHTAAQQRRQRAAGLADRQRRHRAAAVAAAALATRAAELAGEQERLAAAQAAVGVETLLRLRATASAALRTATDDDRVRRSALPLDGGLREASPTGLAGAEHRLRAELGRLEAARADERRRSELTGELAGLAAERARAEELAEEAQDWLVDYDGRLKALQEEQAAARAAESRVEHLDGRRADLTDRLAAAERRDALRARIATAEHTVLDLRTLAQDARARTLDLQERRLAGMAAELAGALHPGEACRVCGSAEHPAPARPAGEPVTAADERRARDTQRRAEEEHDGAEAALTALRVEESAAAASAGTLGRDALAAELAEVRQARAEALRAADGLGQTAQRIDQLVREQQGRQQRLREAGERTAALAARTQALATEVETLAERIAAARGDAPSVAARAAGTAALAESVAAALAAAHTAAQAAERLAETERELREAALAAGFADADAAGAAVLPATERTALRERLERFQADRAAAEAGLADPELMAAAAEPPVDQELAQAELLRATERLRRAAAEDSAARERCLALGRIGARLTELAAALAPALERYGRISRLAGLVAGAPADNALRMRLESYVLAARLEQVAAAASDRLVRMSGGRYTLVHSDGLVSGNKRSGLSLRVVDAWTGSERDTATLSGGESFFASLALALGLADVVTDEAGGMPLDTLFIDEGFGSLDEHTLEEVMDVLDGLRERDRAVGIVSHVADLRSRIPSQLLVRKHRQGSTLRLAGREDR
ncbi:AAA family ATPase [Kitasatospora sp. NPDC088346]|uniref:AAA family ATPase n=1 Tax=Kitasatospora sp. NPDC088346 TaxID=3364073 RepID=UPI003823D837